ncbi:hypothetical protein PIB30_001853 [Stylosanthes scabra]|uniref:Uncharacterized protein n=1 Tax=Stylosanthes scabra TaxID=79078 RepID=A0ABU6W359_9FABA|nr:hypothetical protein [Stylosanthes scabra]
MKVHMWGDHLLVSHGGEELSTPRRSKLSSPESVLFEALAVLLPSKRPSFPTAQPRTLAPTAEVQELRNSQNGNGGPLGNGQGGGGSGGGGSRGGGSNDDSDPHSDGGSDSDNDTDSNSGDNNNHTNTHRTTRTRTHVSDSIAGGATKSEEENQPFSDEIMAYRMPSNLTLPSHFEVL